jgi:hypothetical protein
MATKKQKQDLVDILKFTPITVQVMIQGYGGESYAGTVDRSIYEYFKEHKIDLDEYANDWDENFNFVPADMRPFEPSQQYDCDNLWHASGAELDGSNLITVSGPDGDIWEHNLDYNELEDAGVTVSESGGCDLDDEDIPEGKVIYNGAQGEKGCFFDGEFTLRAPFDPKKLTIHYENCGGWWIVTYVEYDGEEIDGSGGYSTTGKWGENKWILPGDEEVYEPVSFEDREEDVPVLEGEEEWASKAIDDTLSDESVSSFSTLVQALVNAREENWNTTDTKPTAKGVYEVKFVQGVWPLGDVRTAEWTGRSWKENGKKAPDMLGWREFNE